MPQPSPHPVPADGVVSRLMRPQLLRVRADGLVRATQRLLLPPPAGVARLWVGDDDSCLLNSIW